MDILRTYVGRQFCRHLNTRGKREARRILMRQYRQTKNAIQSDLMKTFVGRSLKEITPAEIAEHVRQTAEQLCGPDLDLSGYRVERDGNNIVVSLPQAAADLIRERL